MYVANIEEDCWHKRYTDKLKPYLNEPNIWALESMAWMHCLTEFALSK